MQIPKLHLTVEKEQNEESGKLTFDKVFVTRCGFGENSIKLFVRVDFKIEARVGPGWEDFSPFVTLLVSGTFSFSVISLLSILK